MNGLQSVIELEEKLRQINFRLRAAESMLNSVEFRLKDLERKR